MKTSAASRFLGLLLALSAVLNASWCVAEEPRQRIPILLDTDIGGDIDDAFALALVLTSPELDLRGVTTVDGDARMRATLACRFLDAVGRPGVPVAAGKSTESAKNEGMHQYGLRASPKSPVKESAVEFLYQQLKADPGNVTLVAIGPLTNVAALLEQHPDARPWIKQIVLMGGAVRVGYSGKAPAEPEWNIKRDVKAARAVLASGVPLLIAPLDATATVKLDAERRRRIFSRDSLLAKHLQALYELWGKETPVLYDPVAVSLLLDESFCTFERLRLEVADDGLTRVEGGRGSRRAANARVATGVRADAFLDWYEKRIARLPLAAEQLPDELFFKVLPESKFRFIGYPVDLESLKALLAAAGKDRKRTAMIRADADAPYVDVVRMMDLLTSAVADKKLQTVSGKPVNVSKPVPRLGLPARVHVAEDYNTEIERRWWLSGLPVKSGAGGSFCRAMLCRNFDRKMGDRYVIHRAVIFNPVPGPPMGPRTRLSFRYRLHGADELRVQIYSLSNGYHRFLTLTGLPQDEWREATVDMTAARRPDGSGGPLSEDERIDDIQFYTPPLSTAPDAELSIDDIVLYDEAPEGEREPFPRRILFTGWFDTGRQGVEWPGRFEIVPHEPPPKWKVARSLPGKGADPPELVVSLRGRRPLAESLRLRLRYRLHGAAELGITLSDGETRQQTRVSIKDAVVDKWTETTVDFTPAHGASAFADEIAFNIPLGAELMIDDLLLYEPDEPSTTKAQP